MRPGEQVPLIRPEALRILQTLPYPGNVRELRQILLRAKMAATRGIIDRAVLEDTGCSPTSEWRGAADVLFPGRLPSVRETVDALIQEAIRRAGGRQNAAARLIGISPQALSKRLQNARNGSRSNPPQAALSAG